MVEGIVAKPKSAGLIEQIRGIGERVGPCVLLAVSEGNIKFLADNREQLGLVNPVVPPLKALATVLDKSETLAIAATLGIYIPRTIEIQPGKLAEQIPDTFNYPVVLKWKNSNSIFSLLEKHHIPYLKTEFANSREELDAILDRYAPLGLWPLIQEYCPSYGLGQFFSCIKERRCGVSSIAEFVNGHQRVVFLAYAKRFPWSSTKRCRSNPSHCSKPPAGKVLPWWNIVMTLWLTKRY